MNNRIPPQNIEMEQAVLSACLYQLDEEYLDLEPSDFYRTAHSLIFSAIKSLHESNEPIDVLTVAGMLGGNLERAGGGAYLSTLLDIPQATDPVHYTKRLKEYARLRRVLELSNDLMKKAYNSAPEESEGVLDYALTEFLKVGDGGKSGYRHIKELAIECIERCEDLQQRGGVTGVPSGFVDLDAYTCGFQPGDLILLAARPGMGKTALAINCIHAAAERGHKCAFNSLEMAGVQVGNRFLSMRSKIKGLKFRSGMLTADDFSDMTDAAGKLSELPIWIDDSPSATYQDLQKKLRRQYATEGIDIAWIDYLGFIDGDKDAGRVMEIQSISRALKATAKELNIPIVLVCQLNRMLEQRNDKRPILSDLRDSGALEQDADLVMFLYRDEVYCKDENCPTKGQAELHVAKQRNGPTGRIGLVWEEQYTRFLNAIR